MIAQREMMENKGWKGKCRKKRRANGDDKKRQKNGEQKKRHSIRGEGEVEDGKEEMFRKRRKGYRKQDRKKR